MMDEDDFESIHGTALHEAMFRNRMTVYCPEHVNARTSSEDLADRIENLRITLMDWLDENCHGFYHVREGRSRKFTVFVERDSDAVHFKMAFHDMDEPEPEPIIAPWANALMIPQTTNQVVKARKSVNYVHHHVPSPWNDLETDKETARRVQKRMDDVLNNLINGRQKL